MKSLERFFSILCLSSLAANFGMQAFASVAVEEEEVVFRYRNPLARRVFLVGDFNAWNPTLDLMVPVDSIFEVRLFLVPGRYSYRFLVDGEYLRDGENPCIDEKGNSCFTLVQMDGRQEISFGVESPPRASVLEKSGYSLGKDAALVGKGTEVNLYAILGLRAAVEGSIETDFSVGGLAEAVEGKKAKGSFFLLRGRASYSSGNRSITFYSRNEGMLDEGTLLPIFGSIGPYEYPLSSMSRGMIVEGRMPGGMDAWFAYVSRIEGYRSAFENSSFAAPCSSRVLLDSDALAARISKRLGFEVR